MYIRNMCVCILHTQDPLKEKETEMIMDYIERFNEVTYISYINEVAVQ